MRRPPPLPLIGINGTAPEALLEQQKAVAHAARKLLEALSDADPNGRDYPDFESARAAQVTRAQQVHAIMQDAYAVMEHVQDYLDERELRRGRSSGRRYRRR